MRAAMSDYDIVEENGEFIGVFLGYDFVAEHEFGINKLNSLLDVEVVDVEKQKRKIKKHELGVNARRIRSTKNVQLGDFEFKKKWYSFLLAAELYSIKDPSEYVINSFGVYLEAMIEKKGLATAWSENDFCIVMPVEKKEMLEDLYENMKKKNVMLSTFRGENPFSNSSLGLLKINKIPDDIKNEMLKGDIASINLAIADDKTKIKERLKAEREKWYKKYPQSNSSPWDYMALSPRRSNGHILYWLNPSNQDLVNSGWYKVKELEEWIEQKPNKIVPEKNWDKLLWSCKTSKFKYLTYVYKDFLDVEPKYHRSDNFKKIIKATPKSKEKDFEVITSHILYLFYRDLKDQVEILRRDIDEVNVRTEQDERVFGFTEALSFLGLGSFGASNTPKDVENFSWLRDTLSEQAWFILAKEKGLITDEDEEKFLKK